MNLEKACYRGELGLTKAAIDAGAEVTFEAFQNAVNNGNKSEAAKKLPIVKLLIDAGADPNLERPDGHASILEVASESFSSDILQLVLDAGADVSKGCPLHSAVSGDRPENIRILLAAGADASVGLTSDYPDELDEMLGMSPIEYAKHLGHKKCVNELK